MSLPPLPDPLPHPVVDSHCHLDSAQEVSGLDPAEAIEKAAAVGVTKIVQIGCDLAGARFAVEAAERWDGVIAGVAIHPNDAARMRPARLAHQPWVLDGRAAQDDPAHPRRQPAFHVRPGAYAAAELHRDGSGGQDGGDRLDVDGAAGEGAVEIDDVQPGAAGVLPGPRLRRGVAGIDGGLVHAAPPQADAGAVLEVDRRVEGEAAHDRRPSCSSLWSNSPRMVRPPTRA